MLWFSRKCCQRICSVTFCLTIVSILAVSSSQGNAALEWKTCWFTGGSNWPEADCGYLQVPEDRSVSNGRTVTLPFVVFKASSPQADEPPVLVTGGGGPGNPYGIDPEEPDKIDKYTWYNYFYMSIDDGRDLIVMDNRGVGSARPRLDCPEVEDAVILLLKRLTSEEESVKELAKAYGHCKERLQKNGVDLGAYNSVSAAQDIEDLRISLGLSKLNVYGISYGTRIALTYLREFPESVHALVLDSIEPPEVKWYEAAPREDFESLKRVFDLCSQDQSCQLRYGEDLYERFEEFLATLDENPTKIRITDSRNFQPVEIWLTSGLVVASIFSAIYDEDNIGAIPRAVTALMNGSTDYMTELVRDEYVKGITIESLDEGAYASYECYDEFSSNDFSVALKEASTYPLQKYMNVSWILLEKAVCEIWDVGPNDSVEANPVSSDVPALLYVGELDPATPRSWARSAAQFLPNSRIRVWDGIAHGVLAASECADSVAAIFLSNPSEDPFSLDCLEKENPVSFEMD